MAKDTTTVPGTKATPGGGTQVLETSIPPFPEENLDTAKAWKGLEREEETELGPGIPEDRSTSPIPSQRLGHTGAGEGQAQSVTVKPDAVAALPQVGVPAANLSITLAVLGAELRAQVAADLKSAIDELKSVAGVRSNGITAQMVGAQFNCPECGMRILGGSLTSGKADGNYEHPWGEPPNRGGVRCRLQGVKFKPPVIFIEALKPLPLTPKS